MPTWKGIVGDGFTPEQFENYIATVSFDSWRPQFIVLHNTAVPTLGQWHDAPGEQRMRSLEHYYRDIQHWSAGPHLFVADDLIWVFTPLNVPGVHSPSWNAISWGVEMVGDYTVEELSDPVRINVVSAVSSLHALMGMDPNALRFHKEDPRTTHNCPGQQIIKTEVISWIVERMSEVHSGDHAPGNAVLVQALGIDSGAISSKDIQPARKRQSHRTGSKTTKTTS